MIKTPHERIFYIFNKRGLKLAKRWLKRALVAMPLVFLGTNIMLYTDMRIRRDYYLEDVIAAVNRGEQVNLPTLSLNDWITHASKHNREKGLALLLYPSVGLGHAYFTHYIENLQAKK